MPYTSESAKNILSQIRREYPGVKLLALGQTVLWDEPMKSILRGYLDQYYPEAVMAVGIHDADYFSRIPSTLDLPAGWSILPHSDGSTRDLWVATGEISQLFGSETIPSRELLARYGGQLDRVSREYPGGRDALIDSVTEAWGWRGLVHKNSEIEVACCVPLKEAVSHLIDLIGWACEQSKELIADHSGVEYASQQTEWLISEVRSFAETHPDASITDLFRHLLSIFYNRLLGYEAKNVESTSVSEIFRFNRDTAGLPRFNILRRFIDPETRSVCQESYDLALEGSEINKLDRFCSGAIPFDLVVPGRGRGTICIEDDGVSIDFDEPMTIKTSSLPSSLEELAALVEEHFGTEVSLVGKAITLVLMMSTEFVFVLNEQASAYVPYCEKMAAIMREGGVDDRYYPILRIDYRTWDSIGVCDTVFRLPEHLASAFKQSEMTSTMFAESWRKAVQNQRDLLDSLASAGTEDLLQILIEIEREPWEQRLEDYLKASSFIKEISERTEPLKIESVDLRDGSHKMKAEVQVLEKEKGDHFRGSVKPLMAKLDELDPSDPSIPGIKSELETQEAIREEITHRIEAMRIGAQDMLNRSLDIKHTVKMFESGPELIGARKTIKSVEYESELARLRLIRNAILTSDGLSYTDHRPSAWWFFLVDRELKWFHRITETTEFRFEPV